MDLVRRIIRLIPVFHYPEGRWLVAGLFLGSLLDLISLATLFPLLLLVTDGNSDWIQQIPIGFQADRTRLGIGIVIAFLLLTVVKAGYYQWITQKKAAYAYRVGASIAHTQMQHFFALQYQQYSSKDYSNEMNRLSNLPLVFANNAIVPAGTLLTEVLFFGFLLLAVALFDYLALLMVIGVVLPALWLYSLRKKAIKETSEQIKSDYPRLLKAALQMVEGWRDIKVFHREGFFIDQFLTQFKKLGNIFSRDHALHTATARLAEVVAAACITVLIVYALIFSASTHETLLLFGVYAAVAFRAIPSVSRILAAHHQIQSHQHVLNQLEEVAKPSSPEKSDMAVGFEHDLRISNLCFSYGSHLVCDHVSFHIRKGELVLLQGKSGTGKTTLALLLSGMLPASNGNILIDGVALNQSNITAWKRMVAYVPQEPFLLDASIAENIAFGLPPNDMDHVVIDQIMKSLDLQTWVNGLPQRTKTVIGERGIKVSGGQRQRLVIGRALYHKANLLLLDEITNQLDSQTQAEVVAVLKYLTKQGLTVVMISHQMADRSKFDSVLEFRDGKVTVAQTAMPHS